MSSRRWGTDTRVNIFDPRSFTTRGDEWNQNADGVDRPIIMVMSKSDLFELLRMRRENLATKEFLAMCATTIFLVSKQKQNL